MILKKLGVRPEDVAVRPDPSRDAIQAKMEIAEPLGSHTLYYFSLGGHPVVARTRPDVSLKAGETVHLQFHPQQLHIFDRKTGIGIA